MMKTLGSTDIVVSCAGLGTVKFGRTQGLRYPHPFEVPTDGALSDLLACAKELGINLLDTAPAYGVSEERLGKLLKGQRHHWVLCTKVGEEFVDGQSYFDFSSKSVIASVERSLKRLNTDLLDIVLVHSNGEDKKIIEMGIFDTLDSLKRLGKIRAYGMSTKTLEGGLMTVDYSDVVMVTYNPNQKDEQAVIAHAHLKNKGVLIKKALSSGHLNTNEKDPVFNATQFIFKQPGVHSIIFGTLNPDHLIHNVKCIEKTWTSI